MSLRKLSCFTTLAFLVIFPAVKTLQVHFVNFDVPTANLPLPDTEISLHNSLWYVSQAANQPGRLHSAFDTGRETSQTVFLPAQFKNPEDLGVGKLLVASRDLADPIFAKTVILLVHYDAGGVIGLMLNRRSDVPLSRVFEQLKAAKKRSDPVYLGGPVETSAVFGLLRSKAKREDAERILGEVYLISARPLFEKTLSDQPDPGVFHVYLGYAGWTPEQLRNEVQVGAWFIFQGDAPTVFESNPERLWSEMIRRTELKMASTLPGAAANLPICETVIPLALRDRNLTCID